MSIHNYTRTLVDDVAWDILVPLLAKEIKAALPGKSFSTRAKGVDVVVAFVDDLTAPEVTTLDDTVAAHRATDQALKAAKVDKLSAIDSRTGSLIGEGFEYPPASGIMFSLSSSGQFNVIGMELAKDDPAFVYPVEYNSKNDEAEVSLADSAAVHGFFLTGLAAKRGALDSGTALKTQVRAATTVAEVEAIVDNR